MADKIQKASKDLYKEVMNRTQKNSEEKRIINVKGVCIANKLNIREKPDQSSTVLAQLKKGDIIEIYNDLGDWLQIFTNGQHRGFVAKQYIEVVRYEKVGRVTANTLNVRLQPYTNAPILGHVKKNDIIKILKEYQDWVMFEYNKKQAFLFKEFLQIDEIPMQAVPDVMQNTFFNKRSDLDSVKMEATKKINVPSNFHEALAAKLWNNYGGLLKFVSDELKIDVATAMSILCVESSGEGFVNGKMIIRFENHVFDMYFGKKNSDKFEKHFKYDKASRRNGHYFRDSENGDWQVCHTGQEMEWKVFEFARKLDEAFAIYSISMGAPQVMGFNYKFIGYNTPQEMFDKFSKDIRYQLYAFFDFCKYKPDRVKYLQQRDFYQFAYEYNGPTDPGAYEQRMKKYYEIYKNVLKI